ncbi:MAG: shikimate dehydrogenase family protein [Bacteroidales bacterium]
MKKYGLIGYPLSHSFSQRYFTDKFEKEQIDAVYDNYSLSDIDQIRPLLGDVQIGGLNVTIPYKEQVIPFLDCLDETAKEVGAVNVIRFEDSLEGRKAVGCNSDVIGFRESIRKFIKPYHQKALVLGTGGASKAVVFALRQLGVSYQYVSRKADHVNGIISYDELSEKDMAENLIIINTTPLGMYPETETAPAIPYEYLTEKHLLFDLVYNPEVTRFLQYGKDAGATSINGLEMLYLQAEAAWIFWNK